MKRKTISPRFDYKEKNSLLGFEFADNYWLENAYYEFTKKEIDEIYNASTECYTMYIDAVENVIANNRWKELGIPDFIVQSLIDSWEKNELSLYGRFDFAMINGVPKLLEFNADTPTSLFEAAIVQWAWKEEMFPKFDQFNSLHESLIESWKVIDDQLVMNDNTLEECNVKKYHFACLSDNIEDATTTAYILSTATDAGLNAVLMDVSDITLEEDGMFYDDNQEHIDVLFKLYPYEWMFSEEFGPALPNCATIFIEPLWKAIMSNKQMLVILAEMFPDSPYILDARNKPLIDGCYCKKPVYSREGANVSLYKDKQLLCETSGEYGAEGFIYQSLVEIEPQGGMYPVIGSWIIGGESCGIGIRETSSKITDNMANFVPHIII